MLELATIAKIAVLTLAATVATILAGGAFLGWLTVRRNTRDGDRR